MYNVSLLQNKDSLFNITKRVLTAKEYLRADPKNSGRGGRNTCYIDAFYFTENSLIIKEHFTKKRTSPRTCP